MRIPPYPGYTYPTQLAMNAKMDGQGLTQAQRSLIRLSVVPHETGDGDGSVCLVCAMCRTEWPGCRCLAGIWRTAPKPSVPLTHGLLAACLKLHTHYNQDPTTLVFSCRLCKRAWNAGTPIRHAVRCRIGLALTP